MNREDFAALQSGIPMQPGIYRYYNRDGQIIYVGKAKHLRKRVSSYFYQKQVSFKTQKLVEEIHHMEFTVVPTEQDALLLENSLIKQYQPKYNMALKDDRSYPYIVIKKEEYPRVFLTRRFIQDGSEYLGPYTSVEQVKAILELIRQTLPIRSCSLPLTEKTIARGRFKECLEYHIGNCKAPCTGWQSRDDYLWYLSQIHEMLKGKMGAITRYYKEEMQACVSRMEFEKAEIARKRLEFIRSYQSRSVIVNPRLNEVDVCTIGEVDGLAAVHYMQINRGTVIHTFSVRVDKKLDESMEDMLTQAYFQLHTRFQSRAQEVIVPFSITCETGLKVTIPRQGDKYKLLQLASENVRYFLQEEKRKRLLMTGTADEMDMNAVLSELQTDLHLPVIPHHIECFDNSNFQGAYPVSAMVCFKEGLPSKKDYRHFHVRTVEGIDDFATMKEAVFRRYKRLKEEGQSLPQLVIIDGGKGQLHAACEALQELQLMGHMSVVGLAKKKEELFYPGDQESLQLAMHGSSLLLLRRIRDEVHRFGITFHRKTRSRGTVKTALQDIKGIGEQTATALLTHFKSVRRIQEASIEELAAVVGRDKAQRLVSHYKR